MGVFHTRGAARLEPTPLTRLAVHLTLLIIGAVITAALTGAGEDGLWFLFLCFGLAVVWLVGAGLSRVLRDPSAPKQVTAQRRPLPELVRAGVTYGGALIVLAVITAAAIAHIPTLSDPIRTMVGYVRGQYLPFNILALIIAGIAEEVYFRGALYTDIAHHYAARRAEHVAQQYSGSAHWHGAQSEEKHPVPIITAVIYFVVTALSGVVPLAIAAAALGIVTGYARARYHSLGLCIFIHLVFTLTMVGVLPVILR